MRLPEGYRIMSGKILRLNEMLYRLRQSPRVFSQLLTQEPLEFGLEMCVVDLCIFRRMNSWTREVILIVVVYVDDSKVSSKPDECKFLREHLDKSLRTNVGPYRTSLGANIRETMGRIASCFTGCVHPSGCPEGSCYNK